MGSMLSIINTGMSNRFNYDLHCKHKSLTEPNCKQKLLTKINDILRIILITPFVEEKYSKAIHKKTYFFIAKYRYENKFYKILTNVVFKFFNKSFIYLISLKQLTLGISRLNKLTIFYFSNAS